MTAYTLFRAHYRIQRAGGRSVWFSVRLALSEVIRPVPF
jgi:hypothetical protein